MSDGIPAAQGNDHRWRIKIWLPDGSETVLFVDVPDNWGDPTRLDTGCLIIDMPDVVSQTRHAYGPGQWLRYECVRIVEAAR